MIQCESWWQTFRFVPFFFLLYLASKEDDAPDAKIFALMSRSSLASSIFLRIFLLFGRHKEPTLGGALCTVCGCVCGYGFVRFMPQGSQFEFGDGEKKTTSTRTYTHTCIKLDARCTSKALAFMRSCFISGTVHAR